MRSPARHDLAWLDRANWLSGLRAPLPDASLAWLDEWFAQHRPAVVTRQDDADRSSLRLGVAMPPSRGKCRIALAVDPAVVSCVRAPLRLRDAVASAPPMWKPALADLLASAAQCGVEFAVYGSLAWQHLSGESFVTSTSDVDLLWTAADPVLLDKVIALLLAWEQRSGLRADGEVLLPDGAAVAWKELLRRPRMLLVKHATGVELRAAAAVLSFRGTAQCSI